MAKVTQTTRTIRGKKRAVLKIRSGGRTRIRVKGFANTTDKTARKKGLKRVKGHRNNPDFRIKKGKKLRSSRNSKTKK